MIDYEAVLRDLEQQRKDLDMAIQGIRNVLASKSNTAGHDPVSRSKTRFAMMSVRWAILWTLSESDRALPTGEITQRLLDGGTPKSGQRFNSNVSAVLSVMVKKDEVASLDNGYGITKHGQEVWNGIKASPKYQSQVSSEP
jgi:hypothetical protein